VVAIATREDVGLHAFGFLTVWATINWLRNVPWRRSAWILGFAAGGLAYSAVTLWLQHRAFPDSSSFVRIYLDNPPFSHLSVKIVTTRLQGWLWFHPAIILSAVAALLWSARARNPYIVAGYIACIPWAVLHLLAASDLAGLMVGYYAYPFLIAMVWPLLGVMILKRQEPALSIQEIPPAIGMLAIIVLSLLPLGQDYNPGRIALPDAFLYPHSSQQRSRTDRAIAALVAARPVLGRLVVDNSVAALLPLAFARTEIAGWANATADTVIFFADGFDAARLRATPGLSGHYSVPGTKLRIETDRPYQTMLNLGFLH
jgi:hypothetical protein